MKQIFVAILCVLQINLLAQTDRGISSKPTLENATDSLNYFLGLTLGYSLTSAPFPPNTQLIAEGLRMALHGKSEHSAKASKEIFEALHQNLPPMEGEDTSPAAIDNLKKGMAFLAENSKKEGVTTTESGLQYKVLTLGDGPKPTAGSTVKVHYEGSLIDGTVFDSSYKRGEPISFPLKRVIAGWIEGLQTMPVGSVYNFYIPSDLAYGSREAGIIPPNSVLIFKIELLGIE